MVEMFVLLLVLRPFLEKVVPVPQVVIQETLTRVSVAMPVQFTTQVPVTRVQAFLPLSKVWRVGRLPRNSRFLSDGSFASRSSPTRFLTFRRRLRLLRR